VFLLEAPVWLEAAIDPQILVGDHTVAILRVTERTMHGDGAIGVRAQRFPPTVRGVAGRGSDVPGKRVTRLMSPPHGP
jgi:flavin reductase (DIM6/NTAB) family NADH-FMN oxidoreductase RutF